MKFPVLVLHKLFVNYQMFNLVLVVVKQTKTAHIAPLKLEHLL